jgi:DnaJ-class molecular chaperone
VTPPSEHDPQSCTACRGTGKLISGLGGEPHDVRCPWCEGTGRFIPGHDAQAAGAPAPPVSR